MAYSDFSFTKLYNQYGIDQESVVLFKNIPTVDPSDRLKEFLLQMNEMPLSTEKAKSEALIFPIIFEMKQRNKNISIFSGYTFNIDSEKDLTGAPDFIISAKPNIVEPQRPIFCLVESKNAAPEAGFAQCAAEMYAARLFNQQKKYPLEIIYGAVTNARDWIFLKLEGNFVYVDLEHYNLVELPKLLGVLQFIVDQAK